MKTNKEYSAVLAEIEGAKVEKDRLEEEILGLMELQERIGREVVEGEARLRPQEAEAKVQEAAAAEELRALEVDVEGARSERESVARDVPRDVLAQYRRILKGRAGLAVALVGSNGICSGCRVTLTPQRFNEARQSARSWSARTAAASSTTSPSLRHVQPTLTGESRSRPVAENLGPFDYVIVGAGTAGCVLANRLSADPATRVLLLEAGGRDNYFWIWIPVGYLFTINNPRTDWCFRTEAEPGLNGRALNYARGTRPRRLLLHQRDDLHARPGERLRLLGALGNRGWSWREVLPTSSASRTTPTGPTTLHGVGGELRVEERRVSWEILDAWREAAAECGIPKIAEFNRGDNFGNAYFQVNQRRGVRVNMVRAFLTPVRHRPNLTVLTDVHVRARAPSSAATAARAPPASRSARGDGSTAFVTARREVVLAAGAIGSPQILQLSGIGPGALLQAHGIPVLHALPGVGENLHDHLQIRLMYKVRNARTLNERANSLVGKAAMGLEYLLFRTGPLTMPPSQLGAFAKSDPAQPSANIEWHVQPLSLDKFGEPLHPFPAITPSVCNLRPTSRGHVRITSPDPTPIPRSGELPRHPRGPAGRGRRDALHPPDHGRPGARPLRAGGMAPGAGGRIRRGAAPCRRATWERRSSIRSARAAWARIRSRSWTTGCACTGSPACGSSTPPSCRASPRATPTRRP